MDWDHARSLALEQPHRPEVCNPDKKGADASEMHNRHVLLQAELLHTGFPSGTTVFAQLEEHDTDGFEDDGQSTPKSVARNCNFEVHCILESAPTGFVQDVPLLSWGALWPKKNEASLLRLLRKTWNPIKHATTDRPLPPVADGDDPQHEADDTASSQHLQLPRQAPPSQPQRHPTALADSVPSAVERGEGAEGSEADRAAHPAVR